MVCGQGSEQFLDIPLKLSLCKWAGAMLMPNLTPPAVLFLILRHREQSTQTGADQWHNHLLHFGKVNEGIRGDSPATGCRQRSSTSRPVTRKAVYQPPVDTPRKIVRA